jgi:hypothetical protein
MTRLERTRQEPYGLGDSKVIASEMYVFFSTQSPLGNDLPGVIGLRVCVCDYQVTQCIQ